MKVSELGSNWVYNPDTDSFVLKKLNFTEKKTSPEEEQLESLLQLADNSNGVKPVRYQEILMKAHWMLKEKRTDIYGKMIKALNKCNECQCLICFKDCIGTACDKCSIGMCLVECSSEYTVYENMSEERQTLQVQLSTIETGDLVALINTTEYTKSIHIIQLHNYDTRVACIRQNGNTRILQEVTRKKLPQVTRDLVSAYFSI